MAHNDPIGISYNSSGQLISTDVDVNFRYRVVDAYEGITNLNANNDHLISLFSKNFYFKEVGDSVLSFIGIQSLNLNNAWLNQDTCTRQAHLKIGFHLPK